MAKSMMEYCSRNGQPGEAAKYQKQIEHIMSNNTQADEELLYSSSEEEAQED